MLEVGRLPSKPFRIIAAAEPDKRKGNNMKNVRNRAWRRFKNKVNSGKAQSYPVKDPKDNWVPEKKWKLMGRRWHKLQRAKQLGFEYPRITVRQLIGNECDSYE